MHSKLKKQVKWLVMGGLPLLLLACLIGGRQGTVIPPARPADFEVQTATPTPAQVGLAETPTSEPSPQGVLTMNDAPTHTPDPNAPPTPPPTPLDTPVPENLEPAVQLLTSTTELTGTEPTAAPTRRPSAPPDPPRQGGEWDFEADFIPWPNPYGEPCPGASVAAGWTAFVEDGPYGSSCLNENLYAPNVLSGAKSQEMTFDFISANSGVFRAIPTKVGHNYNIIAHAKHDRSISPVEMALGVDLTGGTEWTAETVQWFPWDQAAEDTWAATEETVTATGETMTIFIKGYHPMADQGGKTVIDDVRVIDLGP